MIGVQPSLGKEFLYVPVRQGKTQVSTDREDDHLRFELPPLEETAN